MKIMLTSATRFVDRYADRELESKEIEYVSLQRVKAQGIQEEIL